MSGRFFSFAAIFLTVAAWIPTEVSGVWAAEDSSDVLIYGGSSSADTPQYSGSYSASQSAGANTSAGERWALPRASVSPAAAAPSQGTTVTASVPTQTPNLSAEFTATAPASSEPVTQAFPSFPALPIFPADTPLADTPSASTLSAAAANPEAASMPPAASAFPEFARNAYATLEEEEANDAQDAPSDRRIDGTDRIVAPRERQSLVDRERTEKELEENYKKWITEQKAQAKKDAKTPRYLQPLSDDRAVFDDPSSPFARQMQEESEREHTFIRQITAADLNMMSDVSSDEELMDWEKEQDGTTDWSKYSASALYNKWRDFLGMGPNEKEALAIMKKACETQAEYEKTKEQKTLRKAAELYEKASKKWPDSLLEEDALFYAAECRYFDRDYTKALTLYRAVVTKYSNSVLKKDSMERLYRLGCYWVQCNEKDPLLVNWHPGERPRFSDFAAAKKAFETIFLNEVSENSRAPDALFALANAYMRRGVEQGDASFEMAARYYQQLYEFYPACDHVDKAYQLAMLALYSSYRGPMYDSTPLKRAAEIAEAAQKAGHGDAKVLAEQLRLIRREQARYLLVRGEYYEKQKKYASARSFYNRLASEYPESEFTEVAAERYGAIRGNPAEADQFALVRPILPFLPKSNNKYYEDRTAPNIESYLVSGGSNASDALGHPDFTALETTANGSATAEGSKPPLENNTGKF